MKKYVILSLIAIFCCSILNAQEVTEVKKLDMSEKYLDLNNKI